MTTDILVITGLSGAGRSNAADDFEDMGWFVVDNLPITLMDKIVELGSASIASGESNFKRLALVVGPTADQSDVVAEIRRLRKSEHRVRVLFLDATTPELVKRYGSTRRKHPLDDAGGGIAEAIGRERVLLEPVKAEADLIIDTSTLTVHELKARIAAAFANEEADATMQTAITSFGFKHGMPLDVDLVMDVRFLPNPHWIEDLRPLNGLDEPVRRYVMEQPATAEFLERFENLLDMLVPAYVSEGKSYLSIAIGCTGGQHRSVVLAEEIAGWLRRQGYQPRVTHRDTSR
jgi:RNase adapter protein RapZ